LFCKKIKEKEIKKVSFPLKPLGKKKHFSPSGKTFAEFIGANHF